MTDDLLAIGAFARSAGLTQKALRLYDELGLLAPAYVDPRSGYRFYAPAQFDRALLVAWLRRLDMPLARIRDVVALPPSGAAAAVAAFWADVEHGTAARRELADLLVDHLTRKATAMTKTLSGAPFEIRYAVGSDVGARAGQQDATLAGPRALAVADGCGPEGTAASGAALAAFADALDGDGGPAAPGDVLGLLQAAVAAADAAVGRVAASAGEPPDGGFAAGTTFTALVPVGHRLALVHVGDSRIYLLRDGGLFRVTQDDSMVQGLVDVGRLTPEEAWSHPQRALLTKVLTGGGVDADVRFTDVLDGDRYLVCSDGLSAVVPDAVVREALAAAGQPQQAVAALLEAVRRAGAPDNVSVVVADVRVPVASSAPSSSSASSPASVWPASSSVSSASGGVRRGSVGPLR